MIGTGEHSLSILAKHNQMVHELYSFDLKNNRLFISQHKLEVLVDKVSSFQSVCK
ncbi:hypothetical protein PJE062_2787 [Pseudovibrio sp. JE062]|nr:hypothetical protein PJE062_2787 [Pseudovibrio sp. JE062]